MEGGQNLELYAFEGRQNASSGCSEIYTAAAVSSDQLSDLPHDADYPYPIRIVAVFK